MEPTPFFIFGLIYIAIAGLLITAGMKPYKIVQFICAILGLIAAAIIIGVFASAMGRFIPLFNEYAAPHVGVSDPYHHIIDLAKDKGFEFVGYDALQTLGTMAVMWLFMCVPMASNVFAGEIKRADEVKVNMLSMAGAGVACGAVAAVAIAVISACTGWKFFTALSFLSLAHPEVYPIPAGAGYTELMRVITTNPVILAVTDLGMAAAAFVLVPMDIIWFTRYAFAWSFDRITPSALADVHPRLRSPVKAIILNCIIGAIWWWLLLYTGVFTMIAASLFGTMIVPLLVSITGIIFPYVKKEIYEASPVKKEIAGIPQITIVGVISTIYMLIMLAFYASFGPLMELAVSSIVAALIIAIFVICFVWYYAVRAYRLKKEAIDIGWAFKEIPPG